MSTIIITDSACDLPGKYIEAMKIPIATLSYKLDEKEYRDELWLNNGYKDFYNKLRNGERVKTSQVNMYDYYKIFKKYSKDNDILYIGFSSALSGSVNNAYIAAEEVKKENSKADITIIDSKSASLGQGLLVYYAAEMLLKGYEKEDIVHWIENNKLKVNHWFTVDSLFHLKNGGRISSAEATLGTMLNVKPVLNVNDKGELCPVLKVRGRKKSIKTLFEKMKNNIIEEKNQVIFISHGDVIEDAVFLKKLILEEYGERNIVINNIGGAIGAHSGPGTLALFFIGKNRY